LKKTRPLWPPQQGVCLQEPKLGKTNPRVTLLICLRFVFHPLSRTRLFLTLTRLVVVINFVNFSFALFTPPFRRLSVRPGHVSVLDPCPCQGFPCPGTLLRPGPYSEGSGPHPRDPTRLLVSPGPLSGSGLCVQGSGAPSRRSGSTDTSWKYHLSLPYGAP
jgi:hypothetical protein